jgi:C-terminal processing protease CtpA/Prc
MRRSILAASTVALCALLAAGARPATPRKERKLGILDIPRAQEMLREIHETLKQHYYDPRFHGVDIDARFAEYENKIKQAPTLDAAFSDIADYLSALRDSHTFFVPPPRPYRFDYGFRMQMIGDNCFVTEVRPDSDAASKLHPGDQILSLDNFRVNRGHYRELTYFFYQLAPQRRLQLAFRDPAGTVRNELVQTKLLQEKRVLNIAGGIDFWQLVRQTEAQERLLRQRWVEAGDTLIWKMPEFDMSREKVKAMIGRARKYKALILDLRGNPGGRADTLEDLVGYFFDHDLTIATRQTRKPEKPALAKTHGKKMFTGKLIVLVDSRSASAAELFARIMQLEHRGTVVGDRSAGAVMEAQYFPLEFGMDRVIVYGLAVTSANLIMTDGKSLENTGVTPDALVLPTPADLAAGRDPALSRAAALAGVQLDPAAAGKLFPFEWAPID